jgi:hypothetical protein
MDQTGVPIDAGRDAARDAAVRELSDPAYRDAEPSGFARFMRWLLERLDDLFDTIAAVSPGGLFGLLVMMVAVVAAIVVIRLRVGKVARNAGTAVFAGHKLSAADHRRSAESAAARGELAEAVRERFRAIVRGLEETGVLDERSGRTVDEVARAAGSRLPARAGALRSAARVFDDVWYGGQQATAQDYQQLSELDLTLAGVRR